MARKIILYDNSESVKFSLKNDHFCIILPSGADRFDDKVEAIKAMSGKWWDSKKKRWYVPVECFRNLFRYCREFSVKPTAEAKEKIITMYADAQKVNQVV